MERSVENYLYNEDENDKDVPEEDQDGAKHKEACNFKQPFTLKNLCNVQLKN